MSQGLGILDLATHFASTIKNRTLFLSLSKEAITLQRVRLHPNQEEIKIIERIIKAN
jgi:hypothetical protein